MPELAEHLAESAAASRSAGLQACQRPPGNPEGPRYVLPGSPEGLRYVLLCNGAVALSQSQPSSPIIVKIVEPETKSDLEGLSDVLLGSLGLTGAITLAALLLGALLAGVMFYLRSRSA